MTLHTGYAKRLKKLGSAFRTRDAEGVGISRSTLKKILAAWLVERVERGLYRVIEADITENITLLQAYRKVPKTEFLPIRIIRF